MLLAECLHSLKVAIVRDNYSTFTLDWLHKDSASVGELGQFGVKGGQIVVLEEVEAGSERAELVIPRRVITRPRSSNRTTPEISRRE